MPAQEFFSNADFLKDYSVKAEAPEGALPAGAVMTVTPLADETDPEQAYWLDLFADSVKKHILAVRNPENLQAAEEDMAAADQMIAERMPAYQGQTVARNLNGTYTAIQAFSLTFTDANGNTVAPLKNVKITILSGNITPGQTWVTADSRAEEIASSTADIALAHIVRTSEADNTYEALIARDPNSNSPAAATVSAPAEMDVNKQEITFAQDVFGQSDPTAEVCPYYALITTETPQTENLDKETAVQTDPAAGSDAENSGSAAGDEQRMYAQGNGCTVTVSYTDEAGIPEGSTVEAKEIRQGSYQYRRYLSSARTAVFDDIGIDESTFDKENMPFARFYDITIKDPDGNKIDPAAAVRVEISYDEEIENVEGAVCKAVHFGDKKTEVIDTTVDDTDGAAISFDAEGFSVYGVVYTVDFHWEVNGKTYDFSIPGGGYVSLQQLVEVLGIASANENSTYFEEAITLNELEVSEAAKKFVEDVESVEFSNPELIDVSKVESKATVGEIKENRGLNCEYSEELTEEQIAEINAQTVEAGDWALISLQPFTSEETLKITMKNREVFTINVTDALGNNPYGLNGQTFVIVNYKNNTNWALTAKESNGNKSCLAGTDIGNNQQASQDLRWTFEYTGIGKEFLIKSSGGQYLLINNNSISLSSSRDEAVMNPIVVTYDNMKDKYSFKAKNSNQALNNYGKNAQNRVEGFGRWDYNAGNSDFWMQLRKPDEMGKPGLISTADTRAEGITINLFDYGPDSLDNEGNKVEGNHITNEGINKNHPLKFVSHGTEGDSMNHYTGGTDQGGSTGSQYRAMQGIVQPGLSDGYPVLTGYSTTEGSLQYLFDPADDVNGKTSYADVNHLFIKDEKGFYRFDSNMNYAYYDTSGSNANRDFKVYANSFSEEGTVKNEKVGFFPFNDYNSYYNCIHGGTAGDLDNGFKNYSPHNGQYSDKLGHYNHHFGLSVTADFVMTSDGKYNDEDMTFSFSGDDDMWVFVDGVLVLDIGGIHNPVSGSINFRTGDVSVSGAKTVNSTGALAGPATLTEAFSRVTGKKWDSTPFSTHKLQVFYLERGGMYSNCKIGFNLPTYKTLSLSKRLTGLTESERAKYQGEEFKYEVVVNNQLYNGRDTVRFNASGEVIESGFEIKDGQVSIKDGETVTITGLHRTDTFYAAEEKSLNMEQFEVPHAERNYVDDQQRNYEEEVTLTQSHTQAQGVNLDDWKTDTYRLENTEKVTFTNTLKEKDLEVEKKWEGSKDHPDNVKFTISASVDDGTGKLVPYEVTALKEGNNDKQFTLSESGNWRAEIEHLPALTPDGKTIVYDISEMHVEGFVSNTRDLTAEKYNYCDVDVVKFWPDEQPHSEVITIKLKNKAGKFYAGKDAQGNALFNDTGEPYELKQSNDYTHRFERLPADDTYTVVQEPDQDDNTNGLVSFVRNIIQYEIVNTPTGSQVDPEVPQDNPEVHKRIDALRDKVNNPDTTIDDPDNEGEYSDDLVDLYRLYLDYKINSLQSASGVDLLFVIDHSGSMNSPLWQGNPNRAPAVMQALNGENGLISQFLAMNEKNQWAAVGFKGPDGALDYRFDFGGEWLPRTNAARYNAGINGSEVLSPGGEGYVFTRDAASGTSKVYVDLPDQGANILTNYTAGLWRAEQFLLKDAVKNDGRKKVVVFISDGIPTLHIDCENATLEKAGTANGSNYYRDQYGGCPSQTLTEFGYFVNDMASGGYVFGDNMEFYTIGFGATMQTASGSDLLNRMLDIAYGQNGHDGHFMTIDDTPYSFLGPNDVSASSNKLKDDLCTIMGMNETFSNIVIQDDLSKYVDLVASESELDLLKSANAKVTMTDPDDPTKVVVLWENGSASNSEKAKFTKTNGEQATIINRLEYDASTKAVKAVFDPAYEAKAGITYTLSFDVKTTDEAYSTYANSGYDKYTDGEHSGEVIKGDSDTDFKGTDPVNTTSSGKEGFRSNDTAKATYKHNDQNEGKEYPHPVIQVFNAPIQLLKTDQSGNPLAGAKFSLYKNAYDASGTVEAAAANTANLVKGNMQSTIKGDAPNQVAEISVEKLKPGTYYLVETDPPAGYNSIAPIKIEVSVNTVVKDGVTTDTVSVKATQGTNTLVNFLTKPTEDNDQWILKVQNNAGIELPSTGASGTRIFTILGSILILGAGVLLWRRRRLV